VKCPTCNTPLKPLLTSWYCPLECDIKAARWTNLGLPEPDALFEFQDREPTQPVGLVHGWHRPAIAYQPPAPSAGYLGWSAGMTAWLAHDAGTQQGTVIYCTLAELVPVGQPQPACGPKEAVYLVRFDTLVTASTAYVTVLP
jgi:hypothetical protein